MEEGIIARLLASVALTALVGNRLYPVSVQQGSVIPCVVYTKISGAPIYTDDGETSLQEARFQIDCYGNSYTEAKQVARAVKAALSAFVGASAGHAFHTVLIDSERDNRESGSNNAAYLYRVSIDFVILADL